MKKFHTKIIVLILVSLVFSKSVSSQDLNQIIGSLEIDTLLKSGPKDNRVNWAFQNRSTDNAGNNFESREQFVDLLESDLLRTFDPGDDWAQVPYAQYRDFFNIYSFWWPEALGDHNGWNFNIIKEIRDSLFLPWATSEYGWATLFSTTRHGGGGGSGLVREKRVGDGKMYGMGWETFLHEFGHTMPGLLDEYSASGEWSGGQCWETPNTTGQLNWSDIPWRLWIDPDTPLPTPYNEDFLDTYGAFEGALTNYFGCHRPTARGCYMGAGGFGEGYGLELCGPCVQRVICYLYKYVNVIEQVSPSQGIIQLNQAETLHFEANVLSPVPNTQKYEWVLNGKVVAEGVTEIDLLFDSCARYELTFSVLDTNELIKYDPDFDHIYPEPYQEKSWMIELEGEFDAMAVNLDAIDSDCRSYENGAIEIHVSGGSEPYTFLHQKKEITSPYIDLATGSYRIDVVDANNCGLFDTVYVGASPLLDPSISSTRNDGLWTLMASSANYNTEDLEFLWSTGSTQNTINDLPDGDYTVTLTNSSGCQDITSVSLFAVDDQLEVFHEVINASLPDSKGRIYLDISQGLAPYKVYWYEKVFQDLTSVEPQNIQASGTTWGHLPEYAFDDNINTKWLHFVSENAWISHYFPLGAIINTYSITSADDVPERDPKHWRFEGSNDGVNWDVLDEQFDHMFDFRYEKRTFLVDNDVSYEFYRVYVVENYGDGSIQLQELEFIGDDRSEEPRLNPLAEDMRSRIDLDPGVYVYKVYDANQSLQVNTIHLIQVEDELNPPIQVTGDGYCQVIVKSPVPEYEYYWFNDAEGKEILHKGTEFKPGFTGNYYVRAVDKTSRTFSLNSKGFAVQVEQAPQIQIIGDSLLTIIDPNPELTYLWYNESTGCSEIVSEGNSFDPEGVDGFYYVSAFAPNEYPDPMDPDLTQGLIIKMDASDLNGDGFLDDPPPGTSSILNWDFENGNHWANNNWFAYRSNYQNGLGIVDFATIWLQRIENPEYDYQSILMAYKENLLSFPGTAPFEGLSYYLPKGENSVGLLAESAPLSTLNGKVFLNGEIIDPITTQNPFEFCVFGATLTEKSAREVFYTDMRWEGQLGELLLWDHALGDEEMAGVSEYLRRKWISTAELESPRSSIYFEGSGVNTSGIHDKDQLLIISPNPAFDVVNIGSNADLDRISMYNFQGIKIFDEEIRTAKISFDLSGLPHGIYIVQGFSGGVVLATEKLVVNN